MAAASDWRRRSRAVIAEVMLALGPSATAVTAVKALRDAYPFGERKHWPYKVWLDEVNAAMATRFGPPKPSPLKIDRACAVCGVRAGAYCRPVGDQQLDLSQLHEGR